MDYDKQMDSGNTGGMSTGENNKKGLVWKIVLVIVIIAALVAGYFYYASDKSGSFMQIFSGNKTLAIVNGEKIKQKEFDKRLAQAIAPFEAEGGDLDASGLREQVETQLLQDMIHEKLLLQYAKANNISVTDEEVNAEYERVKGLFGSEEEFMKKVEEEGLTLDEVRTVMRDQLIIRSVIDQHIASLSIEVTDEEVRDVYDRASESEENLSPFEEVKEEIREQIKQKKTSDAILAFLNKLAEEGDVEIKTEEKEEAETKTEDQNMSTENNEEAAEPQEPAE
ncbi:SurA N-terminal domain-containing protein [bacterium]|nr:SurA N-terminal domain-containing protein [bacterium]